MSRMLIVMSCLATIAKAEIPGVVLRQSEVIDVALTREGALVSRCQNERGQDVAAAPVTLAREGRVIAQTVSGPDGWFALPKVSPGVYELRSTGWQNLVRVWTFDAAPPAAGDPIVLVLKPPTLTANDQPLQQVAVTVAPNSGTPPPTVSHPLQIEVETEAPTETLAAPMLLSEIQTGSPAIVSAVDPDSQVNAGPLPAPHPSPAYHAQAEDDTAFNPFYTSMSVEDAPLPPGAPAEPYQDSQPHPTQTTEVVGQPVLVGPPPTAYVYGPTVGDVVTAAAGVAGLTVGIVALYKYDRRSERVRIIVSP